MEGKSLLALLCFLAIQNAQCENSNKSPKISLFNVVTFPNSNCAGIDGRNGTCYTAEECDNRDGLSNGQCAEGYGVCCVVTLACGGSSAENTTYLELAATTTPPSTNCEYKLCGANANVCRIRFDFEVFIIDAPFVETFGTGPGNQGLRGGAIGDCISDTFSVAGSQFGSPSICGTNTGQHLYADVNADCITPRFLFGGSTNTRQYRIKTTQYVCGDEMGGPIGCLQYFTAVTGTVASFNYPLGTAAIGANPTITHLSDQHYDICFRRASGNCRLCFSPTVEVAAGNEPASYGLGLAAIANPTFGRTGTACTADYLVIPEGVNGAVDNPISTSAQANNNRICGRVFTTAAAATPMTICTSRVPFSIKFRTDQDETSKFAAASMVVGKDEVINDAAGVTPGYLGFSLNFLQEAC